MERRRQNLQDHTGPQALGRNRRQPPHLGMTGLGETLSSTEFKSKPPIVKSMRPKLAPNPEARKPTTQPLSEDSELDPIDFLSSQEGPTSRTGLTHGAISSTDNSNRAPQPPPFMKAKATRTAPKPPPFSATGRNKVVLSESDDFSLSSYPPKSLSSVAPKVQPQLESLNETLESTLARQPAPPPFTGLARHHSSIEPPQKTGSAPPRPVSPPFRGSTLSMTKPKRAASASLPDEPSDKQLQQASSSDPTFLKSLPRIPKKGQPMRIPVEEPLATVSKRMPAEFPMAAYAREVAAKTASMNLDPPSPRKRFRPEDIERLLQSPMNLDDSLNLGDDTMAYINPEELCPFCDEPLPEDPSPDLLKMLAELKILAIPEPRARNPLGLTAPLTTFINLCHMHRAESTYVQQGKDNSWPIDIDWNSVRERLMSPRILDALRRIILDPKSSIFFVTLYEAVKRDGALKAGSIKAQLANFELSHPGYYGEQGSLIFFDILMKVFPDLSPNECKPLQPREFFLSVLVPEAAALLVEEDMDCTHDQALVTLQESRQYGQMMFPDRGDLLESDNHMGRANAKQLQWRKAVIQTGTGVSSGLKGEPKRRVYDPSDT